MSAAAITVRSFPERIFSFLPVPFWLAWLVFWMIIAVVDYSLSANWQTAHSHLTELFVCVFHASVITSLGFSRFILADLHDRLLQSIDDDPRDFTAWYNDRMRRTFMGPWPVVAGVIYAIVTESTVGAAINEFNRDSDLVLYYRMAYRILGFLFIGSTIWSLFMVIRLPSQLMRFRFKLRLGDQTDMGLRGLGVAFFKLSMLAIGCFTISVIVIMVSPLGNNPTVIGWLMLWCVVILAFFILPQIGIHRVMAADKRRQVLYFSNYLQDALQRSIAEPTAENFQKLKELFELQNHFRKVSTWPFDVSTLWQLISALLFPLLLVLLQIFLSEG